jgi:poly-gamma-glutamate synthesis protein (capsule biosynthesis protein)
MVREDVAAAKAQADLVIPFFHWGREGSKGPDAYQLALAKAAVESGAAAVLGSHPHVLHGMERIGRAPVFYSLGNFVFGGTGIHGTRTRCW